MAHYRPDPKEVTKRGAKASVGRYAASDPAGDRKPPDRAIGFVGMLIWAPVAGNGCFLCSLSISNPLMGRAASRPTSGSCAVSRGCSDPSFVHLLSSKLRPASRLIAVMAELPRYGWST
jgi:hypothetical protein